MAFIDGTIVNVALPALQNEFGADIAGAQWVVEAYALLLAALLLVGGAAGDRYGRRRVFLIGVVLFAAMSVACGLAASLAQLIAARALQGVGAALMVPGSLAIIGASFGARERGKAIGLWSGATSVTAALGPLLGGWLIDHLSWRAAFFLNLPLAAFVVAAAVLHVPESKNWRLKNALDWPGAVAATLGLAGIVFGLTEFSHKGWNGIVISALAGGIVMLAIFFLVEDRSKSPMVPLKLFRSKIFLGANLLTLLLYSGLGGGLFFLPLNLVQIQHYSATEAGAALLPFVAITAALSRWAGGLTDRYGARLPLIVGPSIAALAFALFALPAQGGSYWLTFFPPAVVLGFGMAITVAPLTTAVLNSVQDIYEGAASGINNAASRIAAVLAIALFGAIFTLTFNSKLTGELQRTKLAPALQQQIEAQRMKLGAIELPAGIDAKARAAAQEVTARSFVSGFRAVMLVSALLALLSTAISFWLIEDSRVRKLPRS
jgi:EmrB/QacA subfamily drug resistance transporter